MHFIYLHDKQHNNTRTVALLSHRDSNVQKICNFTTREANSRNKLLTSTIYFAEESYRYNFWSIACPIKY